MTPRQRELLQLMYTTQRGGGGPDPFTASGLQLSQTPAPEAEDEARTDQPTQEKPLEAPKLQAAKPLAKSKPLQLYNTPAKAFIEGMVKRGWTPQEAAGAAGNVHVESGFKPYIKSSAPGEQSYGLLQWNGARLRGLQQYAQLTGKDWTDPETQMDWINLERTGDSTIFGGDNESHAYHRALSPGGTPADIAERFGRYVERPLDLSQSVDQRRRAADQYAGLGQSSES
jgi:hypothetical protein